MLPNLSATQAEQWKRVRIISQASDASPPATFQARKQKTRGASCPKSRCSPWGKHLNRGLTTTIKTGSETILMGIEPVILCRCEVLFHIKIVAQGVDIFFKCRLAIVGYSTSGKWFLAFKPFFDCDVAGCLQFVELNAQVACGGLSVLLDVDKACFFAVHQD